MARFVLKQILEIFKRFYMTKENLWQIWKGSWPKCAHRTDCFCASGEESLKVSSDMRFSWKIVICIFANFIRKYAAHCGSAKFIDIRSCIFKNLFEWNSSIESLTWAPTCGYLSTDGPPMIINHLVAVHLDLLQYLLHSRSSDYFNAI